MGPSQYKENIPVESQGSCSPRIPTMEITNDIDNIDFDLYDIDLNQTEEKVHYRQNQSNGGQQSPRAAKYREGVSKGKFAKYITVPDDNKSKGNNSLRGTPSIISGHDTTRSRGEFSFVGSVPSTSYHPGHEGTIRGAPVPEGTITGRRNQPAYKSWNGTIPNGTISRGRYSRPGTIAFRRGGMDRKEYYVQNFGIEVDKNLNHRYAPGEEISGNIVYDVTRNVEIRFIEFQVIGQCAITTINSLTKKGKTKVDKFLCKRKYIVGTPDGRWTSLITPGHYVSSFRFKLPQGIPSTLHYEDNRHGFGVNIDYMLKVRICDDVGSSSARSNHSLNNLVKVLLSRRLHFTVRRNFDIHTIPMGLTPILHTEDIQLSCAGVAIMEMALDRTCFLAGDDIQVRLETQNKYARKIKSISCELVQRVTVLATKLKATYSIILVEDKHPEPVKSQQSKQNLMCYDIHMHTLTSLLPSILPGCRTLHVTYTILINVKFKSCGGKLTMEVPISIGPHTDHSNVDMTNSVPQFNRPLRFPHFRPNNNVTSQSLLVDGNRGPHVNSKFTNEGCVGFLCCFGNNGIA